MKRVSNIEKEQLENFLKEGKTTKEISIIIGKTATTVSRYIREYGLESYYKKPKLSPIKFDIIDTKQRAYILGFIVADGSVYENESVEVSVAIKDKEVVEFIASEFGQVCREDLILNKKSKKFPKARMSRKLVGIKKLLGGCKKKDRNIPRIKKDLEVYLVRGIFEADGCITWGRRKDRNRIWHKVSFTSSQNILTSLQQILIKRVSISSIIRPKSGGEDCFVLEFANKEDVMKFYEFVYNDKKFMPFSRKFEIFNALRLELGEFSENVLDTTLSGAVDLSTERAETTGEINGSLNNQISAQGLSENDNTKI